MNTILRRTITHEYEIPFSGEDVADLFWSLGEQGQAAFFNRLGTADRLPMQLQYVTDCPDLSAAGRRSMAMIGDYSSTSV